MEAVIRKWGNSPAVRLPKAALKEAEAARTGAAEPPPRIEIARGADDGTLPASSDKHCGAGSSGLAIDPYGNVYPCVQWRRPVGSLHDSTLAEIWLRSKGLDEVRGLTVAARGAVEASGPGGMLLNFCPGTAESLSGDPLRIYAGAEQRRELLQEVLREEEERKRVLLPVVR